jgi:hypothetical protein
MGEYAQVKEGLKEGESYAGLILGKEGAPDYHLILLPGDAADVSWPTAREWATSRGGDLPTRRDLALLFANMREQFERAWYWSSEHHEFCERHPDRVWPAVPRAGPRGAAGAKPVTAGQAPRWLVSSSSGQARVRHEGEDGAQLARAGARVHKACVGRALLHERRRGWARRACAHEPGWRARRVAPVERVAGSARCAGSGLS